MKAEVAQQRSLLEVAELDAELAKMDHRASQLPERAEIERIQTEQVAANDRLGALQIALEDLNTQVSRFESEIDGVRQREDRDRSLLQTVADSKQLSELQHELETLQRRQSSLEDSLIEVMEHREQLQNEPAAETAVIEGLQSELAATQQAIDTTVADIDHHRRVHMTRRDELTAEWPDLLALYERQRSSGGPGAGLLQGGRCGACRIEIDRGELARISRPLTTKCCAARNAMQSCCGSRVLAGEGRCRGRRWVARQPGTGRIRVGGVERRPVDRAGREQAGNWAGHQQRRRISWPDSGSGGGGETSRQRSRGGDGLQTGRRADVRTLEGQASRPRGVARPSPHAGIAIRSDQLQVDPAGRELPCRPAGERGDGCRGRTAGGS